MIWTMNGPYSLIVLTMESYLEERFITLEDRVINLEEGIHKGC
jgi:hypothetical protein